VLDDSFPFHLDMIYRSFEEHRSGGCYRIVIVDSCVSC
jgi:hypothetical protein